MLSNRELKELVEKNKDELLKLCSDLIRIPSVNPPGDVEEIVKYICDYLAKNNVSYEVLRPTPGTPDIVAIYGKPTGKKLILNGHCDVVPIGDRERWAFDPFSGEIRDGKILGRGTSDMKCGLAGLIFAMCLLAKNNIDIDGEIILTVVPDEETFGDWGTKWLTESGTVKGDACIIGEPTGYFNCEIGQKGNASFRLIAEGTPAHGSLSPFVGENAIVKLLKVLSRVDKIRDIVPRYSDDVAKVMQESRDMAKKLIAGNGAWHVVNHCTVNIGTIKGGTKVNMVADHAEAEIDVRTPIGVTVEMVEEEVVKILREADVSGVRYEMLYNAEANSTDQKADIVEAVAENVKDVWGEELNRTYQWASSDARYFRYLGIPTLQYGPANLEGIHAYNETVDVEDVINATKVYIGAITDYLNKR